MFPIITMLMIMTGGMPAQAQGQVPACGARTEGQVACMSGRLCECRFERGGTVAGRPDRHNWDCGPLRPDCAPPPGIIQAPAHMPTIIPVVPLR
jgi:hypothetical protein